MQGRFGERITCHAFRCHNSWTEWCSSLFDKLQTIVLRCMRWCDTSLGLLRAARCRVTHHSTASVQALPPAA